MRIPLLLAILAIRLFAATSLQAQACECTNCPQFMQDLFVGDFNINIQGATNNTLGQNGQGVCGVIIHFDHTAICDISITLTSPSGQTVTLVGPIGQFCTNMGNVGTDWDVTFLPCGSGAMPDPGFTAQWNSDQPWGSNNSYSGSYYPFSGCLQNFSGSVNGNWVLTVTDGQAQDTGNLYDYEIIFCDPSGINCVSCEPDAGILPQPDVMACQGAPELALDLMPDYPAPDMPPPAPEYSYAYLIAGPGGVIQSITASPDMTGFPAGIYTVCGLSYLSAHQNLLPSPNGALTITQLSNQLNSNTPPFCGNITTNCVNVTIYALPPDEETEAVICAPACFDFLGDFYCTSGDYFVDQTDVHGCHYNAILHLTVNNPTFKTITEMVCPGECSTHPLFPDACTPGQYQITLVNYNNCDSVLTLNLSVMNIDAVIQPPGMLSCTQTTVQLSGIGSTLGVGTTYLWTATNGGTINGQNNLLSATAASAGTYKLLVCRTLNGITCCDSAMVNVTASATLPGAPVINGSSTICVGDTQTYSVIPIPNVTSDTWTVPAGVTILSGQGTTSIVVTWPNATGGNICVFASNACGPGPETCLAISTLNPPPALTLHGALLVCRDSMAIYTADSLPGISTYNWTVTGGAIVSGNGTDSIVVNWNGGQPTGTVCATAANNCGQSVPACLNIALDSVPSQPVITGDSTRCVGSTGNYSIVPLSGATGYQWTVPAGATIVSGQNTTAIVVSWTATPGGNICVNGVNGCGAGLPQCIPVVVLAQPVANAGPDSTICGLNYTLAATTSVAGSTGAWTLVNGPGTATLANPNAGNSTVTVTLSGVYQFQWAETNGICTDVDTVQVTFNQIPVGGAVQHICDGTNQNYTITFPINGGTAPYTVPGGTVTGSTFTSNPIPNGQSFVFVITDANGCVSSAISGVFNCNCATNAGQMTLQLLSACPGNSITVQPSTGANLDADDVGAFVLHTNPGSVLGTILGENTTGTFTYANPMVYGTTYYVSYVVGNNLNGLPDLTDACLSVAPGQPVVFYDNPVANAGTDVVGCGLTLTVSGTASAGSGVWTVAGTPPGGSATIANAQNATTAVTATAFGAYTLTYTVTSNGCIGSDDVVVTYGNAPVTGVVTHVCDGTNQFFTVTFDITGGQAPYTVAGQPVTGSTFTSGQLPNGSNYNFVVTDAFGCTSTPVTGTYTCNCATNAGTVSLAPITACQTDSITVQLLGGQSLDADDVSAFVLHTGSGPALGTVIAQNHTGKFGYWATLIFGTTYYVSVVAGNNLNGFPDPSDQCFSVSPGQPIVFIQNPTPNAGDDFVVCGLTANLPAVQGLFQGAWTQVSGPGTSVFANAQSPVSMVTVSTAGTYFFQWSETNGTCTGFDEVKAQFLDNPTIGPISAVCNGTNTGYTINFTVTNGTGAFTILGLNGTFSGNNFVSQGLANDAGYSFTLRDAFGCQTPQITGTHHCDCTTAAGTMDTAPMVFCADESATVVWNNDGFTDANDGIRFILHDQPGSAIGTILATNTQPVFNFGPGLQTGVTYYISAIAGNLLAGSIDLNDLCLDIAPGTPIQWKALPFAALSGDATICNGSSTVLNINGTGTYPLQALYDDGSGTPTLLNIPGPQTIPVNVSPVATTIYTLISVTDGTLPTCAASLNSSVTVQVNQPVDAGVATAPQELCAGTAQTIQLGSLISGEDNGGVWTETSVIPSVSGAFNAQNGSFNTNGQATGTYTFRYFLQAALPCPSQASTATVTIHPTPQADAGNDQLIDCHQDSATLGGPGTSLGTGIQYTWNRGGIPVATTPQLTTAAGGNYNLVVSNGFGCSDTDETVITVDNDIPVARVVVVDPVQCYGENNGSIVLDSIASTHPPVLFSVNGGVFSADHVFTHLGPDDYTITLQDNNGCEWNTGPLTVTEPPLLTVDLGGEVIVTFGDSVSLKANTDLPLSALESLKWSPLLDSLRAGTYEQDFRPLISRYVTIELVDSNGCKANATVLVRVERPDQVYIPNIFYPGSSGFNDKVTVFGGRGVAEITSFRIFDRWGDQLYEALNFAPNSVDSGWDGTHRGDPVAPGVYVYFAVVRFIDGEVETYKGDVTVLR